MLIQQFDKGYDITDGLEITDNYVCLGHLNYGTMSIWKWSHSSQQYELVQKRKTLQGGPYAFASVTHMKKDKFTPNVPNLIYCVISKFHLYRVQLNASDLVRSEKTKINCKTSDEEIIDYQLIDSKTVLILFYQSVLVANT